MVLPIKTTSTAANLQAISKKGSFEVIKEWTHAATAPKISCFFASVKNASAIEKSPVKRMTRPMRTTIILTKYKTKTQTVGSSEDMAAESALLARAMAGWL